MQRKFISRLQVVFTLIVTLAVISCKKDSPTPAIPSEPIVEMEYFNLNEREIRPNAPGFSLDVNHDGRMDLAFGTVLVGDPLNQVDKLQFLISSNIEINLPVNAREEVPMMNKGQVIVLENFDGYQWFELSSIVLIQKIISFTAPPVWEGHWKTASHKYLPYQAITNGKRYNGWVELTVDIAGEKIILHKAAISKEADKSIKAGD